MSKRVSHEGDYLLTLKTKALKYNNYTIIEPSMFIKVTIQNGEIIFPFGFRVSVSPFLELARRKGISLVEVLEDHIKSSPRLYRSCILNRLGYERNPKTAVNNSYVRRDPEEMERNFIIKILKQKGDREHLEHYLTMAEYGAK